MTAEYLGFRATDGVAAVLTSDAIAATCLNQACVPGRASTVPYCYLRLTKISRHLCTTTPVRACVAQGIFRYGQTYESVVCGITAKDGFEALCDLADGLQGAGGGAFLDLDAGA